MHTQAKSSLYIKGATRMLRSFNHNVGDVFPIPKVRPLWFCLSGGAEGNPTFSKQHRYKPKGKNVVVSPADKNPKGYQRGRTEQRGGETTDDRKTTLLRRFTLRLPLTETKGGDRLRPPPSAWSPWGTPVTSPGG